MWEINDQSQFKLTESMASDVHKKQVGNEVEQPQGNKGSCYFHSRI